MRNDPSEHPVVVRKLFVEIDCNDDRAHRESTYTVKLCIGTKADAKTLLAQTFGTYALAEKCMQQLRNELQLGRRYQVVAECGDGDQRQQRVFGPVFADLATEAVAQLQDQMQKWRITGYRVEVVS